MLTERLVEPTALVLFGVGGDLAWRLITPALFDLFADGRLPEKFSLIGFDRADYDDDRLRDRLREGIVQFARRGSRTADIDAFVKQVQYVRGDLKDPAAYRRLVEVLEALDREWEARAQQV
ncbi:MAG: glucose-6-phosphate dehydrogenase, partial [Myxococcales bacterium]